MRAWRFAIYGLLLLVAVALAFWLSPRERRPGWPAGRAGGAAQDTSANALAD